MMLSSRRSVRTNIDYVRDKFIAAWARTDQILAILPAREMVTAPIVWRHPFLFYVGHLPAFSWNQICGAILRRESFNPYFDNLFCRGIDPDVDTGECHWHPDVPDEWPTLADTLSYRDNVRGVLLESLEEVVRTASSDVLARDGAIFQMVLEHEFMHQETLMYMLQQVAPDKKRRPRDFPRYSFHRPAVPRTIPVPAGKARLGAKLGDLSFGWDNEFDEVVLDVPAFAIESLPVTNGEFCQFVDSGAYENSRYWRAEDWRWKQCENKHHPLSWFRRAGAWFHRAIFDTFSLEDVGAWPVSVSLAEARAYAAWRGKRLPTEAEYHRAAFYGPDGRESLFPWGNTAPAAQHGNFNFNSWSPLPVGSRPAGASRWGVLELAGNGWELTETAFAPFPNFSPYMASYRDYSRDFFDGKHFVLKGASWATSSELLRRSFRNWYQAHYSYVFTKFRCVSE